MRPWLQRPSHGLSAFLPSVSLAASRSRAAVLLPQRTPSGHSSPLCESSSSSSSFSCFSCFSSCRISFRRECCPWSGALHQQVRCQRSISGRPRSSQWREKVQQHDRLREEQRRAVEAEARGRSHAKASALRRQKRQDEAAKGPGAFDFFRGDKPPLERQQEELEERARGKSPPPRADMSTSAYGSTGQQDVDHSNPAAVPVGFSFWQSIRLWRRRTGRTMPLNPLHNLKKTSTTLEKHQQNPDAGHVSRFLLAIEELHGRSRRRNEQVSAQLSDEQKREIVARYAETQWWGQVYLPFKNITDGGVKRVLRIGRLMMATCVILLMSLLILLYKQEMHMISQLSPQDRRDYTHMVMGMRQGDVYKLADEVLTKEDPLYALPDAARCHILLEEARKLNWDKIDWDVECRNRHPDTPLVEGDYRHLLYWAAMYLGSLVYGGAAVFNDSVYKFAEEERDREHREPGQQLEPTAKPESTKRTFFS